MHELSLILSILYLGEGEGSCNYVRGDLSKSNDPNWIHEELSEGP